jgi:hypothetical protein
MFNFFGDQSKQKQVHEAFLEREDIQLIEDLQRWPVWYNSSRRNDANTKQWDLTQASIRFYLVLYSLAKQKKESQESLIFLREVMRNYKTRLAVLSYNKSQGSKMLDSFAAVDSQELPVELHYAINFYLKAEEFYINLLHHDDYGANAALNELYSDMNKALKYSRMPMVGLIYYLQTNLEKMRYALIRNAKDFKNLSDDLSGSVLFTKKEIESLPVRLELNQLIYNYVTSVETDYDKIAGEIEGIEKRTRGIESINYELEILKLFVWIDNSIGNVEQRVMAINYEAKRLKKGNDKFMSLFLSEIQDIDHDHRKNQREEMGNLHKKLAKIAELPNPLHNLILFWMSQFI